MKVGFGTFKGSGAIALGVAIARGEALCSVSAEIAGICDAAGMRSIAPGVVGVEGCVGRDRGGSVDK